MSTCAGVLEQARSNGSFLFSTRSDVGSSSLWQVVYRVYEDADLQPLLDAVNEETQKEKDAES